MMSRSLSSGQGVREWWPVEADRLPSGWHLVRPDIPGAPFLEFVPADPRRWHNVVMAAAFVPGVVLVLVAVLSSSGWASRVGVGLAGVVALGLPFLVLAVLVRSCSIRGVYTSVEGVMCRYRTLGSHRRVVRWEEVRGCVVRLGAGERREVVVLTDDEQVVLPSYVRSGRLSPEAQAIESALPRLAAGLDETARELRLRRTFSIGPLPDERRR